MRRLEHQGGTLGLFIVKDGAGYTVSEHSDLLSTLGDGIVVDSTNSRPEKIILFVPITSHHATFSALPPTDQYKIITRTEHYLLVTTQLKVLAALQ